MVHVLEHTRNPKKVLDKIFEILSDKGYIYIEVPNLKTPYNNLKKKYFFFFHLYYFSDYTLKLLLELSGFKIIKKVVQNGTSIAYVCQKTNVMNETVLNKNEFNTVIRILRNYRYINYPIFLVRALLVNIISFIGLKSIFIKIRKVFL
jgi:2-polyprenyl-3-methyl-5-hydroxy-6-metoxy-1,4-benzoquinol methylase